MNTDKIAGLISLFGQAYSLYQGVRAELAKQGVTDAELAAITADYDARLVRAQAEAAGSTGGE